MNSNSNSILEAAVYYNKFQARTVFNLLTQLEINKRKDNRSLYICIFL